MLALQLCKAENRNGPLDTKVLVLWLEAKNFALIPYDLGVVQVAAEQDEPSLGAEYWAIAEANAELFKQVHSRQFLVAETAHDEHLSMLNSDTGVRCACGVLPAVPAVVIVP